MNDIKIYEAKVESFESLGPKSDLSQKIIVDENSIFSINCVIDFDNYKAIDLETGNVFDILRKNKKGLIIENENDPIKFNFPYVSEYSEKNMRQVSVLFGLQMMSRAKRAYDDYASKFLQNNNVKVKTRKNG